MRHTTSIDKVLVVLSPDLIKPDKPKQSPLIQRALSLAKNTGCQLELFHVCYDGGLEHQLFRSDADLDREREELIDHDATLLAEIATRLKSEGITVHHEVRWDAPRTDSILRKIAQARPDVVMKQAREHNYVLGLTSNTDWELARRSPAHVWLVNDDVNDIGTLLAAVGNKLGDPGDITTAIDYELLQIAGLIGKTFSAQIFPANAFQVPELNSLIAGVGGAVPPVSSVEKQKARRRELVKQHSASVRALAQYFNIPNDNVLVHEGHPNEVIPEVARSIGADMIVMGANSISRLERLVGSVTVEPVMAEASSDILVVRERDTTLVPDAANSPIYGVPRYDLERAITSPEETFESPSEVANVTELSAELRRRILQAWEYDIRAEMVEEDDGGPTGDIDVNALDEIYSARALLEMQQEKHGNSQATSQGFTG